MIKTTITSYGKVISRTIDSYMDRLEKYLPSYFPNISWQLYEVRAREVSLSKYIEDLSEKILVNHPNIVFVELSSDETDMDHSSFLSLTDYESKLEEVIGQIIKHNNRTGLNGCMPIPVIITPPPIYEKAVKTNRTNNRLRQYVYVAKSVAELYDCPVVDVFDGLSQIEHYEEQYLDRDGIKLNQKGEDILYDMVFIELTRLIDFQGVLKDRFI